MPTAYPTPTTLIEHITLSQRNFPQATGSFTMLMQAIALATKAIAREVNRAGLGELMGVSGRRNIHGEQVAQLDEFANETIVNNLIRCGEVCTLASEELAVPIRLPSHPTPRPYAVVFDPLDGSSNIDVAIPVGTIFGVYRRVSANDSLGTLEDILQPAAKLVAAGYAMVGSATMFVYSSGHGVHGFTLDPNLGEFLLSHPNLKIPATGKVYSVNTGNRSNWPQATQAAVDAFERPGDGRRPHSQRYVGSLVADAHRTLLRGGIFMYPSDDKSPDGKLRLLYEAGPLAFLFDQAGGAATNGQQEILNLQPKTPHDRTPLILGSRSDVDRYMQTTSARQAAGK